MGRATSITAWDTATARQVRRIPVDPPEIVGSVAISRDGKTVASASGDCTVLQLWDVATGRAETCLPQTYRDGLLDHFLPRRQKDPLRGSAGLHDQALGRANGQESSAGSLTARPKPGTLSGTAMTSLCSGASPIGRMALSGDGKKSCRRAERHDQILGSCNGQGDQANPLEHPVPNRTVAFAPDDKRSLWPGRG